MTLFHDILFGSSGKRIYKKGLNKTLKEISVLSPEEREYVKGVFRGDLKDGITITELKKAVRDLERNYRDSLDYNEVKKIKEKLFKVFE